MADLSGFNSSAADWRAQISKNVRKTRMVIAIFFLLYVGLGLLIDVYVDTYLYNALPSHVIHDLLTLQLIPYATLILGGVVALSLVITVAFSDQVMLLGTEYRQITPDGASSLAEKQLYNVVEEMKVAAGLRFMPRVYVIEADYMNAFASGYSEKSAMVAITRGLLEKLDRSELQAVMAHEISHVRHLDIKLTLTVAVMSNILLMALDLVFYNTLYGRQRRDEETNMLMFVIVVVRFLLPIVTVILTLYLSRTREYMADAGCVELMRDNGPLARALIKIDSDHNEHAEHYRHEYGVTAHEQMRRAAYLYDPVASGFEPVQDISSWFSTHPALSERLKALGFVKKA